MYETIGKCEPEYLLSDPQGASPIFIPCTPGNGTLRRGQIMKRDANGMYSPAAAADIVNTNHLVVLDEAVDTAADANIAADARAYRAGRMIESELMVYSTPNMPIFWSCTMNANTTTVFCERKVYHYDADYRRDPDCPVH